MTRCAMMSNVRVLASGIIAAMGVLSIVGCNTASDELDFENLPVAAFQQNLNARALGLRPLSREPVPQPIGGHIVNQAAAVRLGKTFFWDVQASSDGEVACATCHQSGGADARRVNTINPGLDTIFASGGVTAAGQTFTPSLITNDDIVGSQGTKRRIFQSLKPDPATADENCISQVDPIYGTERRVFFRNAQTVIGAVFFRQLFWGGESHDQFNGVNVFGFSPNNIATPLTQISNAALASQAVGPVTNGLEMRCGGRPLNGLANSLGAKLMIRPPLQFQRVSPTDSVLGALANPNGPGLICGGAPCSYRGMIAEAFGADYAANAETVFSIVWGEAVQAYEATLIPDQTPLDRFLSGHRHALTWRQRAGLARFVGKGKCITCHAGPMLSDATWSHYLANGPINRDGGDQGFHNIGLVESTFDRGRSDFGPAGLTHSESKSPFDNFAFRTPGLRNAGLTAPYFHTGSNPTLADVVEFYNRGGDAANAGLSADIQPLNLSAFDKAALVDFLANGLTDCRVEKHRAPFDHPELVVVNGPTLPAVGAEGLGSCRSHGNDDDDDSDGDSDH
jgi:cytochrome c peroxidase